MRVLVTGGSGFLGTTVVGGLAGAGHEVVSADLHVPDVSPHGAYAVTHVVMDVRDPARVNEVVHEWRPEVVVHLASIVTPSKDSPRELQHAVDVGGSRNVLDACLTHQVRRIVVSSSGAAYGYHADNPEWITEDQPVRGNKEFAYSDHKRRVEEILADLRGSHPELEQVVLRIGTILGERVDNQITALFRRRRLLKLRGSSSPFVFVWNTDVAAIIEQAVTGSVTGTFNVAGDGAMTIDEIAAALGRPTVTIPEPVLRTVLSVARTFGLTVYGPEQTRFLQYRPVLDNTRLKEVFGYHPAYTSAEAFDAWKLAHHL